MRKYYAFFKAKDFQSDTFYGDNLTSIIMMIRNMAESKGIDCEWKVFRTDIQIVVAHGGRKNNKRYRIK
jgi:hypothetical protein